MKAWPTVYSALWTTAQRLGGGIELGILERLERSQWRTAVEIAELQAATLRTFLQETAAGIPFHAERFREAGFSPDSLRSVDDLRSLPILTKDEVRRNLDELAPLARRRAAFASSTGGSTGEPLRFYQDRLQRAFYKGGVLRARRWYGFERGAKVAYVWGADRDLPDWSARQRLVTALKRQKWLNAFRMTEARVAAFVAELEAWRPEFVIGYASALDALARHLERHPSGRIRPAAIESSAEKLWAHQRQRIEEVFGCPVVDFYGSREFGTLAAQCPRRDGLHQLADVHVVEIVDDCGRPVPPGVVGRVLVTDPTNRAMPFVRYETGDLAAWKGEPCGCGRGLPLLDRIEGRSSDVLRTPDGTLVHGEFFTHLFYGTREVERFQVRQTTATRLVISVKPAAGCEIPRELLAAIAEKVHAAFPGAFQIDFTVVDEIAPTRTGKHRFTISELTE